MNGRYPGAVWRPLGAQTEPSIGRPRILIVHTMVGFLRGTNDLFRRQGYQGTESHFGIGGPWDPGLDGTIWQWQDITFQADAQNAGNAYATSIETSDGGDPSRPWSAHQLKALVDLMVWWCRETGNPPRLVTGTSGSGIGYHAQFPAWAPDGRPCPGRVRIKQLLDYVIPTAARTVGIPPMQGDDDMPLTETDLNKIAARVWGSRFGESVTTGTMLQRAANVSDLAALADRVVASLPQSGTLTATDVARELLKQLEA